MSTSLVRLVLQEEIVERDPEEARFFLIALLKEYHVSAGCFPPPAQE